MVLFLGTDDQVLNKIAPGDTLAFGGQADPNGQVPSKVEFSMKKDDTKYNNDNKSTSTSVFKISNTNALKDDYSASFTGEIENTAENDFSSVAVTVILKKGNDIVYGTTTYVDNLAKGSKTPFEVKCFSKVPEYDSFEIYAQSWGFSD